MPNTKGNKLSKADKSDNKKQAKPNPATKSGEIEKVADTAKENTYCVDCGNRVLKAQAGISCDACGFWHHTECEDVSDEVYEFLCDHAEDITLAWYCKKCASASKKLAGMILSMSEQQHQVESKVEQLQAEVCGKIEQISKEMQQLRGMMDKEINKSDTKHIVAVDEKITKLTETVVRHRSDNHELRDYLQDAVREKLQEDKEELDDVKRRSTNIIIHGLQEATGEDGDAKKKAEEDQLMEVLHAIRCDDVSVHSMVRLGRYDEDQAASRTVKVVLSSENERDQVLSHAKNLQGNVRYGKVFIQQDLTVKQREKRRQLVQQLKQRKANGETNLIIIRDKIVTRRPRPQAGTVA